MSITHEFVNPQADDVDDQVVRPSNWNAAHVLAGMAGAGWKDWSPIVKAGSTTCTWTGAAKYLDLGGMVLWYFNPSFTSGASSGIINITNLPTALQGHDGSSIFGAGMWFDQGVNFYAVQAYAQSSTEWRFYRDAAAGVQFTNAIGTSPQDTANLWGIVTKSAQNFGVPTAPSGAIHTAMDVPPAVPNAANDEFDDPSLTGWTVQASSGTPTNASLGQWQEATNPSNPTWNADSDVPSALVLQPLYGSNGLKAYKAFAPTSGTRWALVTKARLDSLARGAANSSRVRVFVENTTPTAANDFPTDGIVLEISWDTTSPAHFEIRSFSVNNGSTGTITTIELYQVQTMYFAMTCSTANAITTWCSPDGIAWTLLSTYSGLDINGTVSHVALSCAGTNASDKQIGIFEFIRFLEGSADIWDMAGSAIEPGTYAGPRWTSGATFPANPAVDQRHTRTDRHIDYFWDASQWLSSELFRENFATTDNLFPITVSAVTSGRMAIWHSTYNLWLETFYATTFVSGTNNGSNYWTIELAKYTAGNTPTTVASFNTSADSAATWTTHAAAIAALLDQSSHKELQVIATKTGAPGNLYLPAALTYRLVG